LPEHSVVKPPQPFKPAAFIPNERFVDGGVLFETSERHDAARLVDETRGETISNLFVGREQFRAPQDAGGVTDQRAATQRSGFPCWPSQQPMSRSLVVETDQANAFLPQGQCDAFDNNALIGDDARQGAARPMGYASFDHPVGDTRIVTSSATTVNRHFQGYSQTGNNADIAELTRLTQKGPRRHRPKK
jgi:hypothetical protein